MPGWTDRFWAASRAIINIGIEGVAKTLNATGSLACMLGGAGISVLYSMDDTVATGYYISIGINGVMDLGAFTEEFDYQLNEQQSFHQNLLSTSNGESYCLEDLTNTNTLLKFSYIAILSGTSLRMLGAIIKKWHQNKEEQHHFRSAYGVEPMPPSYKEYLYVHAESFCDSVSIILWSSVLAKNVLDKSMTYFSAHPLTYPTNHSYEVDAEYYVGPITSELISIALDFSKNATIRLLKIPIDLSVTLEEKVEVPAIANVTYGGGLFFKPPTKNDLPFSVVPSIVGTAAMATGIFFRQKASRAHEVRLAKATELGDSSMIPFVA